MRRGLDPVIVVLCGVLLVVATWVITTRSWVNYTDVLVKVLAPDKTELAPLAARFGPGRNSGGPEEWIIRDYFQDRRGGVFVDVGASDYREGSNTYFLETHLGWSGLAIDALGEFAAGYVQHRPRTKFVQMFVSDQDHGRTQFFVADDDTGVSSVSPSMPERWHLKSRPTEVPTMTLNTLLRQANIDSIDFLNMDIELAEPQALAGFDIQTYKPQLVCIEAHPEVRQQILDYFLAHRYRLLGKYLRLDLLNLYFAPVEN